METISIVVGIVICCLSYVAGYKHCHLKAQIKINKLQDKYKDPAEKYMTRDGKYLTNKTLDE